MTDLTPTNPEELPGNRSRIEREIRDACRAGGLDILPSPVVQELVDVVVAECSELRARIADRILGPCVGRYECGGEAGITDRQLEMLLTTVLFHYEDEQGVIQLPPEVIEA